MAGLYDAVVADLRAWQAPCDMQESLRLAFVSYALACPDAVSRSCASGHITASTVVLNHDGTQVLLTLHPRIGTWLPLGGHVEECDTCLRDAAVRETWEESGIAGVVVDAQPFELGVHPVTCRGYVEPTRHFDVCFRAIAPEGAQEVMSEESLELRWFSLSTLREDPRLFSRVAEHILRASALPR